MSDHVSTGTGPASRIDQQFRPRGYWPSHTRIGGAVQGTRRRRAIRCAIESGRANDIPPSALAERLPCVGQFHPAWMGGEYLPRLKKGEVTIAFVTLDSTTGDVTAIRARPVGDRIAYRVVDEYPENGAYVCTPQTSGTPLTLGELIRLIDTCRPPPGDLNEDLNLGLVRSQWHNEGLGSTAADRIGRTHVESPYYPDLAAHYRAEADALLARGDTAEGGIEP